MLGVNLSMMMRPRQWTLTDMQMQLEGCKTVTIFNLCL